MVAMLKIINDETGTSVEMNEIILLDCIKLAHHRHAKLKNVLIDIYEQSFKKNFDEELLKY